MSDRSIEALLRAADADAPRREFPLPSEAVFVRMHRRQWARRAAVALLLVLPLAGWTTVHLLRATNAEASVARVTESLNRLQTLLDSLPSQPPPTAAAERAAIAAFDAFRPSAERGDAAAMKSLRWLASAFPRTHGGSSARLLLQDMSARRDDVRDATHKTKKK